MADTLFKSDLKGLEKLIKDLKVKKEIQVGVLYDERSATIGLQHEFGDGDKLPMRSFLMMPIQNRGDQLKEVAQNTLDETGDMKEVYKSLAIESKHIIDGAFESGGYGEWKPLSDVTTDLKTKLLGNTRRKKNIYKILIETGQLRKSIKAKVVNL